GLVPGGNCQGVVLVSRLTSQGRGLHSGHARHVRRGVQESGTQGSAKGPTYGTGGQNLAVLLPTVDGLGDVLETGPVIGRQQLLYVVRVRVLVRHLAVRLQGIEPRVNKVDGLVLLPTDGGEEGLVVRGLELVQEGYTLPPGLLGLLGLNYGVQV